MAVVGVPLRYAHMEERPVLYMAETVRRTLQNTGVEVLSIVPIQNVDYMDTKGSEFPELTIEEKNLISKKLDICDGIFFTGGTKFTPYDRYLLELAIEKEISVLGVCLGMQMLSWYQEDVKLEPKNSDVLHQQNNDYTSLVHEVIIDKDSKLYKIIGQQKIMVNSFYNYHATNNHIYRTTARSIDGQIEAIEYPSDTFNIGVQWHPEISYNFDENSNKIIDAFICAVNEKNKSKKDEKTKELVLV